MIFSWWNRLRNGMKEATRLKSVERALIAEFHADINNGTCVPEAASECLDAITINVKKGTEKVKK